jgi:hypothetical protein
MVSHQITSNHCYFYYQNQEVNLEQVRPKPNLELLFCAITL